MTTQSNDNDDDDVPPPAVVVVAMVAMEMSFCEDELNFSLETEGTAADLQTTLTTKNEMRKNLVDNFATVSEKIEYFESMKIQQQHPCPSSTTAAATTTTTTTTTTMDPSNKVASFSVYLRIRPSMDTSNTISVVNHTTVQTVPPESSQAHKNARDNKATTVRDYTFTHVLSPHVSQLHVYQMTAAPLVHGLVGGSSNNETTTSSLGQSALLFCYGITNAGKTHTLLGDLQSEGDWGILPRTLQDVWNRKQEGHALSLSYYELYNESAYDLLDTTKRHPYVDASLKIREVNGVAILKNLSSHPVHSVAAGLALIHEGKKHRHTATNNLNAVSSRSHSICQLTLTSKDDPSQQVHFWLVDLAGSERSKRTDAGTERQKEAICINKSLMTLMRCLQALRPPDAVSSSSSNIHPPHRDSKLTQILMTHLTGPHASSRTAMIVNVHPSADDYDETQHVLAYASEAKSVQIILPAPSKNNNNPRTTSMDEYDANGHRRKPSKNKKNNKQQQLSRRVGAILQKLSPPFARKRKGGVVDAEASKRVKAAAVDVATKPAPTVKAPPPPLQATVKPPPVAATTSQSVVVATQWMHSKEYKSLQTQLNLTQAENALLKSEKQDLEARLDAIEDEVRSEVAQEMEQQMDVMREQCEDLIGQLKSNSNSPMLQSTRKLHTAHAKMIEMGQMLAECEEEMLRMRTEHAEQMAAMESQFRQLLEEKDSEIAELVAAKLGEETAGPPPTSDRDAEWQATVNQLQMEMDQLRASKQEMIHNYEKMLREDDDGDDSVNEKDDEVEVDEEVEVDGVAEVDDVAEGTLKDHSATGDGVDVGKKTDEEVVVAVARRTSRLESPNTRAPLGSVSVNTRSRSTSSDESFGPANWLRPSKVKKNPSTGTYLRPRGRAPKGTESWDEIRGVWRLSTCH